MRMADNIIQNIDIHEPKLLSHIIISITNDVSLKSDVYMQGIHFLIPSLRELRKGFNDENMIHPLPQGWSLWYTLTATLPGEMTSD